MRAGAIRLPVEGARMDADSDSTVALGSLSEKPCIYCARGTDFSDRILMMAPAPPTVAGAAPVFDRLPVSIRAAAQIT